MLKRKDKEQIVKDLTQELKTAKSAVFTDYQGVAANDLRVLRKKLHEEKISYAVIKKSLTQIALDQAKIKADVKNYKGPLALAISQEDEIAPSKIVSEAMKGNENLKIFGGILENEYLSQEQVKALAKLPSKEELIAKAVGSIQAPISNFVGVLSGVSRQLVCVLKAIEEKKA